MARAESIANRWQCKITSGERECVLRIQPASEVKGLGSVEP